MSEEMPEFLNEAYMVISDLNHLTLDDHKIVDRVFSALSKQCALLERKLELCKEQRRRAYFEDLLTFTKLEKNLDEELEELK